MDENAAIAITAIADARVEGSIAASLHRLGWEVLYRATSIAGLQRAIVAHPHALVIASDDFRRFSEITNIRQVTFQSSAPPISDFVLNELICRVNEQSNLRQSALKLSESKIYLIASNGRTVGTSTIALNFAREISIQNSSTLLLDCNQFNPYLARQLGINGINREIARTSFGFSVGEMSTSLSLSALAPSLDSFDEIVIDFGQLREPAKAITGKRVHEEIFRWALHSNASILLVSRSDARAIDDLKQLSTEIEKISPAARKQILLPLSKVLSSRERSRLISDLAAQIGARPTLISRDPRSISAMEDLHSTLTDIAPKSMLLSEIRELTENLR